MKAHVDSLTKRRWFRALTHLAQVFRWTQCAGATRATAREPKYHIAPENASPLSIVRTDPFKPIDAPPRATVIRCLRPDGDIYHLRYAPDKNAKPSVLLHCPAF